MLDRTILLPCTDLNPHDWADQTLQNVTSVVGSGPRIVIPEMGDMYTRGPCELEYTACTRKPRLPDAKISYRWRFVLALGKY